MCGESDKHLLRFLDLGHELICMTKVINRGTLILSTTVAGGGVMPGGS